MKLFCTLLFACSFSLAFSQTYNSDCTPTPQLVRMYQNDIVKIATFRLQAVNSTYKDSVEIPQLYKDTIAKALYAVYNMPYSSIRDTIRNLFGFSNFNTNTIFTYEYDSLHIHNGGYSPNYAYGYSPKRFTIAVPDTTTWAAQWQAGNYTNTNNPAVNSLAARYSITTQSIGTFGGNYYIVAQLPRALNVFGFIRAFNNIIGNSQACAHSPYAGDGNSITFTYQPDGIIVNYNNNCNDCLAGCQTGRAWAFFVPGNCTVQYLGATDLGIPLSNIPPYIYTCTRGPVLPVTFGTLTGYLQSGKAALTWKVLTQVNVREYVIEKSDNGQQFYSVGSTPANNALSTEYSWKETTLLTGTAWYRIKAVDLDGKSKYSSIVKISSATKGNFFTLYPNPVANRTFAVQFATPATGQMKANLYSVDGKKVWTTTLNLAPSTTSRTITLPSNLQAGVYAFVVESNNGSYRQTLVIAE